MATDQSIAADLEANLQDVKDNGQALVSYALSNLNELVSQVESVYAAYDDERGGEEVDAFGEAETDLRRDLKDLGELLDSLA